MAVCMRVGAGHRPSSHDFAAGAPCCHGDCIQWQEPQMAALTPCLFFPPSLSLPEKVQLASQSDLQPFLLILSPSTSFTREKKHG